MKPPRRRRPRLTLEHALFFATCALLVAGSAWVARSPAPGGAAEGGSWVGSLPSLGLPLVRTILSR